MNKLSLQEGRCGRVSSSFEGEFGKACKEKQF